MAGGANMAMQNLQYARHSLVSTIGPTMVGPGEKNFSMKVLKKLGNAILRFAFVNTVFYKRAVLITFYAEFYRNCIRHSFVYRVYYSVQRGLEPGEKILKVKILRLIFMAKCRKRPSTKIALFKAKFHSSFITKFLCCC